MQFELHLLALLPGWLGLVLITRKGGKNDAFALALLGLSALAGLLGVSLFDEHSIRFVLPSVSLLIVLAGMGYALWWQFLQRRLFTRLSPPRRKLVAAVALLALLVLNLPNVWTILNDTRQLTLPDRRNDLATWADGSLPASKYITYYKNRRTLNREWGGYAGETRFDYAGNVFSATTIDEWRAQGVLFAIVPHFQYKLWREEGTDEFVTETTLLKSYPKADEYRDPGMVVLLLHPIQQTATGQLGPIRLIGYELAEGSARPGQTFPFHLYWQATASTAADYQVFNHLLDAEGNLVAQIDGPPLPDPLLRRGTSNWNDPEEIIYSREYALALPEDLPPDEYTIVTGFYRRDSGQRLLTPTGEDSLWVARIVVE